jgi:LysM repeat protein
MIGNHTQDEVRQYDLFKLVVALILLLLLLLLWFSRCGGPTQAEPTPEPTAAPTESSASQPELAAPVILQPEAGAGFSAGSVIISGTGQPGTQVEVTISGSALGTDTVAADGSWSLEAPLDQPGEYEVIAQASDSGGATAASDPVAFTIEGATAAVKPAITTPASGATLPFGDITIGGTGQPGSQLQIVEDGTVVDTVTVDDQGNWSDQVRPAAGKITYIAQDAATPANASEPVTISVFVAQSPSNCGGNPGHIDGDYYVVGACETLTLIAQKLNTTLAKLIEANPTINPDLIRPGQRLLIPR